MNKREQRPNMGFRGLAMVILLLSALITAAMAAQDLNGDEDVELLCGEDLVAEMNISLLVFIWYPAVRGQIDC